MDNTAKFALAEGEKPSANSAVFGLRAGADWVPAASYAEMAMVVSAE